VTNGTEAGLGVGVASFTAFIGSLLLGLVGLKQPWGAGSGGPVWYWVRSHLKAVLAGGMAYAYYVAAALVAGAEFPKFLQEHLFDGLAPAALIAGLIDLYDRRDPAHAYRKLPVPGTILLMLFAVSAVFFALIGAAAVFGSETNNYLPAVLVTAAYGGGIFPVAYWSNTVGEVPGDTRWARAAWWFERRPPDPRDQARREIIAVQQAARLAEQRRAAEEVRQHLRELEESFDLLRKEREQREQK
jgi:hypothetical protein